MTADIAAPLTEYERLTAATLAAWDANPNPGERAPYPADRGALGITVGCWLPKPPALLAVHDALRACAGQDPLLDVVPRDSLHFTFIALHWDLYADWASTPAELAQIVPLLKKHLGGLEFVVRDLRLVPLKNALLLAGVPDAACAAARAALVAELLESPWRRFLEDRYKGYPLPPRVWHTTLARYRAQYAAQPFRDVYFRNAGLRVDALTMGRPRLVLASENWSRCVDHPADE